MKRKAVWALTLATALLFSAGLTPQRGTEVRAEDQPAIELNEPGTYPIAKEKVEMTMMRLAMPNVVDYETNDFSKFIEELTGVHWKIQTVSMDNADTQVNLAMSSGELPNVFLFSTPSVSRYGVKEQQLMQLDDLIEPNMPNFMAYLKENPSLKERITQTDGHIYALPAINQCYHCSFRDKMWVNTKHLEELGKEMPQTIDELFDVLKAYKEKHPEGVGIAGSIDGWGQQFTNWLTNPFILDPGSYNGKLVVGDDHKIFSIAQQEAYRDALRLMRKLYVEGYLYEGALTQNHEAYRTMMNEPGEPVLFAPYGTISDAYDATSSPEAYAAYRVTLPLKGPKGQQIATHYKHDGVQEAAFVLSENCPYPEVALRFADYFYTLKGYLSMQFGPDEGKDWTLDVGDAKGLDGGKALYKILNPYSSDPQNHDWQDVGLNFATAATRMGQAVEGEVDFSKPEALESLLATETREKCEPYAQPEEGPDLLPALHVTADESDELKLIVEEVNNYIESKRTEFITGVADIEDDAAWQAYLDGFAGVGMDQLIQIMQTAYERQMGAK